MANDESTTPGGPPAPEAAELCAFIQLSGPAEAVAAAIERLAGHAAITVQAEGDLALPEEAGAELARPLWMLSWLRRFPGLAPAPVSNETPRLAE